MCNLWELISICKTGDYSSLNSEFLNWGPAFPDLLLSSPMKSNQPNMKVPRLQRGLADPGDLGCTEVIPYMKYAKSQYISPHVSSSIVVHELKCYVSRPPLTSIAAEMD